MSHVPPSFAVRPARPDDHAVVAALFLELETGDPPLTAERFTNELCPSTLVAERDGEVIAYLFTQSMRDTLYVRHVATARSARRSGAAKALFAATKAAARARGATQICLNVKPENTPAIALYEREGMAYRYASEAHRFSWAKVPGHTIAGVTSAVLEPRFDAELEARFALPAGQIASTRAIATRVIVGLFQGEGPVGLACFDPKFPGAFPVRVAAPALFPALLDACRAHAIQDEMNMVIEDAPALSAWLAAAGAPSRMSFVHYAGPL